MTPPDPDQDLLDKLERRELFIEVLSLVPTFGWALAASLVVFAVLRFVVHWGGESTLDAAGLIFILAALLLHLRKRREPRA